MVDCRATQTCSELMWCRGVAVSNDKVQSDGLEGGVLNRTDRVGQRDDRRGPLGVRRCAVVKVGGRFCDSCSSSSVMPGLARLPPAARLQPTYV